MNSEEVARRRQKVKGSKGSNERIKPVGAHGLNDQSAEATALKIWFL